MAIERQRVSRGEFILDASDIGIEQIVIASENLLYAGAVLGQITESGSYGPYDPNATDGTQTADAVLCDTADARNGDASAMGITNNAELIASLLDWGEVDAPGVAMGTSQLRTNLIVLR